MATTVDKRITSNGHASVSHETATDRAVPCPCSCSARVIVESSSRMEERGELQTLNARLASYIGHVRELKEASSSVQTSGHVFQQQVHVLEEELANMKSLFQDELSKTRVQLDEVCRIRNNYALEEKKAKTIAADFKNRLELECERNQQLCAEIQTLQQTVAQRDKQIQKLRIEAQHPGVDRQLERKYEGLVLKQEENRKSFEAEQLARQLAEEQAEQMKAKLRFQTTLFEQEKQDLEKRLAAANSTICTLEVKVREMSHQDQTLSTMLLQVRESTEMEVRQYQEQSQAQHNRYLSELKAQIAEDDMRISEHNEQTLKLNAQITEFTGKIRQMEAQISSLEHLNISLESDLKAEKEKATKFADRAQIKIRELQETLVMRMRELSAARDAQIPLKAEIESYKALVEAEERRLKIGPGDSSELLQFPRLGSQSQHTAAYMSADYSRPVQSVKGPTATSAWGARKCVASSHGHGETKSRILSASEFTSGRKGHPMLCNSRHAGRTLQAQGSLQTQSFTSAPLGLLLSPPRPTSTTQGAQTGRTKCYSSVCRGQNISHSQSKHTPDPWGN